MIEILRNSDEFNQELWRFYFMDRNTTLYLTYYARMTRATKRHKFSVTQSYERIDKRNNTIKEEDVSLPDDVKKEALQLFVSHIVVKKWNEDHHELEIMFK